MTVTALKEERLSIRAKPEFKKLIATAAAISHESITEFVLRHALKAAERTIAEAETITLNNAERDRFLNLLDNPLPPNAALKAVMQEHRKHLKL